MIDQDIVLTNVESFDTLLTYSFNPAGYQVIIRGQNGTLDCIYKVKEVFFHPEYNSRTKQNGIVIIKLDRKINYTNFIQPACLWPHDQMNQKIINRKTATIVGHNRLSDESEAFQALILDRQTCKKEKPDTPIFTLTEDTFCVVLLNQTYSIRDFNQSSAGGMFIQFEDRWYIRGLLHSQKIFDFEPKREGLIVFTDIAKASNWIEDAIKISNEESTLNFTSRPQTV